MCPADDGSFLPGEASTGPQRLIHRYEAIARASRSMLLAARRGDWEEVARIEDRCRELIEQLKSAAEVEPLDARDQGERVRLLRAILADDAEIRACAEPWMARIEHLVATTVRPKPAAR